MLIHKLVDTLGLIKQSADGLVVVQGVDNQCNVFAHIDFNVPFSFKKLGHTVNEVGGEDLGEKTLFVCFVQSFKAVAEQTEGSEYEDAASALFFELSGNVDDGFTGGDHIVDNDHVFTVDVSAKVFVRFDGVFAVDDDGIVAALIEHTEVKAQNG